MRAFVILSQLVVGLGVLNVWLVRRYTASDWRGGTARTLKEEFDAYGLGGWFMGLIGFLKILLATLLIAGVWFPPVTRPAAIGIALLMVGAVAMHMKVGDPLKRSLPAFSVLMLSLVTGLA